MRQRPSRRDQGSGISLRLVACGLQLAACHASRKIYLVDIAPAPIAVAGAKRANDRVAGGVKVRGGVFVLRGVAAPDMAADLADAQFDPGVADRQAVLAAIRAWRDRADLVEM